MQKKPLKLSTAAARNDVFIEVSHIVEALQKAQHIAADYHSLMFRSRRMSRLPGTEIWVDALDKNLQTMGHENAIFRFEDIHGEDAVPSQHWIVSEWLAERLAEDDRECIILLCDSHYVWLRHGGGYPVEDDLAFLDEPTEEETEEAEGQRYEDEFHLNEEDLDKSGDDPVVDISDC